MNIAILIGVSEYKLGIQNLPGCEHDIMSFGKLIKASAKYDDILSISDNSDSSKIKEKLVNFINLYKTSEINEILFYFTGHGDYANDDFFYILPDFDFEKRTQTSLQNSELDNLIKSLNPQLVVKIVDACHSGVNYIKDLKALDTYIKSTKGQFQNCYFLYSSLNTQSSFQNSEYSLFTFHFLNAIKNYQEDEIRYKNIIDYISDKFINYPEQTPFFVTQADFTEIFCTKNESINEFLEEYHNQTTEIDEDEKKDNSDEIKHSDLESLIKEDAKKNISLERVNHILGNIEEIVENFVLDDDIKNLYKLEIESHHSIKNNQYSLIIGNYLRSKQNQYFASPKYTTEIYTKMEIPTLSLSDKMRGKSDKPYKVEKERQVVNGYSLDAQYEYEQLIVELESNYPNINSYQVLIAFLCSDRDIRLYYFFTNYIKKSWTNKELNDRHEWDAADFELIDEEDIYSYIRGLSKNINEKIRLDLSLKLQQKTNE